MIMVLVLALSMCVVGASAVESDAISETSATVGNERASWGYVKIRYDPNGAWGEGSINTYAGTAYYMYVKSMPHTVMAMPMAPAIPLLATIRNPW